MTCWNDFNNMEEKNEFSIIPHGTLAKVRMTLQQGGYNDESQNLIGDYATKSDSGAIYLKAEFVVLEGRYARRKVWSLIGIHSPKGPEWSNMGRSFIKAVINSARGLSSKDNSEQAVKARHINALTDLDGIEFVAKIEISTDGSGSERNEIKMAITPEHKLYKAIMTGTNGQYEYQQPYTTSAPVNSNRTYFA
jgi:hypothetical protein